MKKYGLKAFVISFFASLFVMFFISKALVTEKNITEDKVIVPASNIVLFFNSDMPKAYSAKTSPIKKIVLNTPLEVPQTQESVESVLALADVVQGVVSDIEKPDVLPLLSADMVAPSFVEQDIVPLTYEKPVAKFEKIIDNYADFIKKPAEVLHPAKVDEAEKVLEGKKIVYSSPSSLALSEKIDVPLLKDKKLVFAGKVDVVGVVESDEKIADASVNESSVEGTVVAVENVADNISPVNTSAWTSMGDVSGVDDKKSAWNDAWKEVKGVERPRNKTVLDVAEKEDSMDDNVSSGVAKNLLIPIPDEIEENPDALPQIMSEGKLESKMVQEEEVVLEKPKKILQGISKLFTKAGKEVEKEIKEHVSGVVKGVEPPESFAVDRVNVGEVFNTDILPTEIRLSFAPQKAEISGQTINWIGAFAEKSKEDGVGLEIRIDGTSSQALQQKRLNLIYNILSSKGAIEGKVKTVFTNREPNSFVIRTIKGAEYNNKKSQYKQSYQQW